MKEKVAGDILVEGRPSNSQSKVGEDASNMSTAGDKGVCGKSSSKC